MIFFYNYDDRSVDDGNCNEGDRFNLSLDKKILQILLTFVDSVKCQ